MEIETEDPFIASAIGTNTKRKFCSDMKSVLLSPSNYFSDITLELMDTNPVITKLAHRIFLASQSILFYELFRSDKGKLPVVKVKQLSESDCNFILEMIYCAKATINMDEKSLVELTKKWKLTKIKKYLKGNHLSGPYEYLCSFLNQPTFSDIKIIVIPKEGPMASIFAHKVILAARSPVFYALLCGPMSDKNSTEIKIQDYSYASVLRYLEFLYGAVLINRSESQEEEGYLKIELLKLSDQYQNLDLKQLCQIQLQPFIEKTNVFEFIQLGLYYNAPILIDGCVQVITERFSYFYKKQEYLDIPRDIRDIILKKYQLSSLNPDAKKAPWVEVYLNTPHSHGLRHGQTISDNLCSSLGFDPKTQKSVFPSTKKKN